MPVAAGMAEMGLRGPQRSQICFVGTYPRQLMPHQTCSERALAAAAVVVVVAMVVVAAPAAA